VFGHMSMVTIVRSTFFGAFVRPPNVFPPEKKAMHDQGSNLKWSIEYS
jgi:hypothetical protein